MAYHREWDRGKDSWSEGYAWSAQDDKTVGREYDDGYYGDGKRRKFNNGVCAVSLAFMGILIQ